MSFKGKNYVLGCPTPINKKSYPEADLQKAKTKVSMFRDFPRTMGFAGVGLRFSFGSGGVCVPSFSA